MASSSSFHMTLFSIPLPKLDLDCKSFSWLRNQAIPPHGAEWLPAPTPGGRWPNKLCGLWLFFPRRSGSARESGQDAAVLPHRPGSQWIISHEAQPNGPIRQDFALKKPDPYDDMGGRKIGGLRVVDGRGSAWRTKIVTTSSRRSVAISGEFRITVQ